MSEGVASESAGESTPAAVETEGRVDAETLPLFSDEGFDEVASGGELHSIKVSGEDKKVPYNELIVMAQKGEAADQKFRDSAAITKERDQYKSESEELKRNTEALIEQLKTDPFGVLGHKSLGLDLEKLLYDKMNEKMEYEELDEYERENLDLRKRVETYETQEQKQKEERERFESKSRQNQYARNITAALQEAGIAATPDTIRIAAGHLHKSSEETGSPTITWRQMVDQTKDSLKQEARTVYGGLTPEQLTEYLGDEAISRIRKADIQKMKNNFKLNQPDINPEEVRRTPKTQMSKLEFRERMNKIKQSLA
tara:strand:- start:383 stop:1318 length:936 start_codon:yes stop_codon:yes gene_type:complete